MPIYKPSPGPNVRCLRRTGRSCCSAGMPGNAREAEVRGARPRLDWLQKGPDATRLVITTPSLNHLVGRIGGIVKPSTLAIWLKPRSRTGRARLLTTRRHTSPIRPHLSRLTRRQQVGPQCARIEFVIDAHAHNIVRDVRIEVDCKRCRIRWQAGGCRNLTEVQV
jgi:hypothetical protein